jgi:predicted DNA-binding transcriptional regulator AlpA
MRLLSKKLVCQKLSVSSATLARWEACSTMRFPKRQHLGGSDKWAKAFWLESDVDEWINRQIVSRFADTP